MKNRGVQDILILCSDGLTGINDAISAAFPKTEYQRCIVHMVRNTLKYVANKDMKAFSKDLKTIYTAPDEKSALAQLDHVTDKWSSAVSICYETLERQRGRHILDLQVFQGCQNSLLYDQCHRITEFNAAAAESSEECISRVSGAAEVAVSRNIQSHT